MSPLIVRRSGPKPGDEPPKPRQARQLHEFVIRSSQVGRDRFEIWSEGADTPGTPSARTPIRLTDAIRRTFVVPFQASIEQAIDVGERLAALLLPPPIDRQLQQRLRALAEGEMLRIRLALDPALIDLPWEFTYRREFGRSSRMPGFLFLDPHLSVVRGEAVKAKRLTASAKAQRLVFLGTYWAGGDDRWGIEDEFKALSHATRPIGAYLSMHFTDVVDERQVARELTAGADIVHYSGHTDVDGRGHYLVREGNERGGRYPWHSSEFADTLAQRGTTRLAVMSACNSGAWGAVQPLLDRGVPAVVGVQGIIETRSATAFCECLYAALAVGLSIDEAMTHARTHVVTAGTLPCDWGRPMLYLSTNEAVLFPRPGNAAVSAQQASARAARTATIDEARKVAGGRESVGAFISERAAHQVLILGRFTARRKAVLDAIRAHLNAGTHGYWPEVFDFEIPEGRKIGETVLTLAGMSRFVLADLTDPTSVPAELEKIIAQCPSVPVKPLLLRGKKPYALFGDHVGKRNVLDVLEYDNIKDLLKALEGGALQEIEARTAELRQRKS